MEGEPLSSRPESAVVAVASGRGITQALSSASALLAPFPGTLHVVVTRSLRRGPVSSGAPGAPGVGRDLDGEAIQEAARAAGLDGPSPVIHVRDEAPVKAIMHAVRAAAPSVVILSSAATGAAGEAAEGVSSAARTATRLLPKVMTPVMLLRAEHLRPPRRIVVATDFSPYADRALDLALAWGEAWGSLAGQDGARGFPVDVELLHISDFARPERRTISAHEALRSRLLARQAEATPHLRLTSRIRSAPLAPDGILAAVAESPPDLLLIGTRGYGALGRSVFGSVAHEVVRRVPSSLVVVPLPR